MFKKFVLASDGRAGERGQALILVLVFLLLGSLTIVPLLNFTATGLKTGLVYEKKINDLYAADAGIQDAMWRVKYDHVETSFTDPAYSEYDFSTTWAYSLPAQVNAKDVNITVNNVWVPKDLAVPSEADARSIIEVGKLMVTGSATATTYKIKVSYTAGADETLMVTDLGVWLPRGFSYVPGSSNLEVNPGDEYYSVPAIESHGGNQAVLWTFHSVPFAHFPAVNPEDSPMIAEITFQFTPIEPGSKPGAVAWIETSGVADIPYSWDADTKIYEITSQAGGTTVESYVAKDEIRRLRSTIAGDYVAVGNSLMQDTNHDSYGVRDILLANSQAVVSAIPSDAEATAVFLYWSGWRNESRKQTVFSDSCSGFGNWISGSVWSINSARFRGHYSSGDDQARRLTLGNSLNLSSYTPGTVIISWDQYQGGTLESDDGLDFAFSADGGSTWSDNTEAFSDDIGSSPIKYDHIIPAQYLTNSFKIRFYLRNFSGGSEYCYIDNIVVSVMAPDDSVVFKIDGQQAYFDGDGEPRKGAQPLTAERTQVLPNYNSDGTPNGFSYSGYKDVTALVRAFGVKAPDPAMNYPGNGAYVVGDVLGDTGNQWSYAGWSLIIIYSSAETEGHQLYLYDKFLYAHNDTNIDFDNDGQPGGTISGFIVPEPVVGEVNAAKVTAFVGEGDECWSGDYLKFNGTALSNAQSPSNNVWNAKSPGLTADGVDIDTFNITWASGLLDPRDTSAQIDLPTQSDSWNFVYLILSFRSQTTTGGSLSYLIR